MRILHVIPSYLPAVRYGGTIFAVHGLCRALVARGNQVEVFTTNVYGQNDSEVPIGVTLRISLAHMGGRTFGQKRSSSLFNLASWHAGQGPDQTAK